MWGGLYGLSKIKVKGRWNPYKYKNQCGYSLERTLNIEDVKKALNKTDLERNKDYVEIYMPCEEQNGYAYIAPQVSGLTYKDWFGNKVKRKNSEVRIWYKNDTANKKKIEIIDREWFQQSKVHTNMEDAELQINNFENFEINNIDWDSINGLTAKSNIQEYQWKNCNVSLVLSSSNFNNLATDSDINLCYHNLDFNSNKRLLFLSRRIYNIEYTSSKKMTVQSFYPPIIKYIKSSKTYKLIYENTGGQQIEVAGLSTKPTYYTTNSESLWQWQPKIELHTTVSCSIIDYNGDEQIISQQIPLGLFYIVEDQNLDTSTISNFIDPMNNGLKDRKVFEKFENLIADRRFAIDVNKNIKSYNLSLLPEYSKTNITIYYNPKTMKPYEANDYYFKKANGTILEKGNYAVIEKGEQYYKWTRTIAEPGISLGQTVTLNKWNFPFNFKLVGETYIRNRYAEDYHYQIELDNCAILDNININLASIGEPTVVNIKMKALTNYNGDIGRLTIYKQKDNCAESKDEKLPEERNNMLSKSKKLNPRRAALRGAAAEQVVEIPQQKKYLPLDILERVEDLPISDLYEIKILHPQINTIFCLDQDCAVPIVTGQDYTYLRLVTPENEDWENMLYTDYYEQIKDELEKEDLLIAKVDDEGIIHGFINNEELTNVDFVNE